MDVVPGLSQEKEGEEKLLRLSSSFPPISFRPFWPIRPPPSLRLTLGEEEERRGENGQKTFFRISPSVHFLLPPSSHFPILFTVFVVLLRRLSLLL